MEHQFARFLRSTRMAALAEPVDNYTVITLLITPIAGDYANANARSVDIRLVPNGPIIIPPNGAPVPAFIITPTPVTAFTPATLDASSSRDEGGPCGSACRYSWDFGDGSAATGMVVSHEFRSASTFTVPSQRGPMLEERRGARGPRFARAIGVCRVSRRSARPHATNGVPFRH